MRITILLRTIIIFGLFASASMSEEYLTTDIVTGYCWRYQQIEQTSSSTTNKIIDYTIDSVWGNPSDTLFFRISKRDSVNYKYLKTDTVYTEINHIVCRKTNRITQCDNSTISEMFTDHAVTSFDSLFPNSDNSSSYPVEIVFNQEQYDGLQLEYYRSGVGTHFGSSRRTTIFSDHLGLLKETYVNNAAYPSSSSSYSFTLLSYNGKSVSYSCGVKPVYHHKGANSSVPIVYMMPSFGKSNLNPGYNLLGRSGDFRNNTCGMQISRLFR